VRFLFITQYFPPEVGAAQVRLASLARELRRMGHDVEVVTAFPNYPAGSIFPEYRGKFYQRDRWEGITVHRTWVYACMGGGLKRIFNYLSFTLTSALGILRSRRADYVFVESPPLFLTVPGYIVSRLWKAVFIFNVADLWPDSVQELGILQNGLLLRLARALEAWGYRHATFVNAVTERMKSILLTRKQVPPSKLLFLPNGVDTDLFRPMPPDQELADTLRLRGKSVVLYAGNHGYIAGLEHALRAAKILESRPNIHFLFVGGGSEKPRLVELARHLNLRNATFLDPVPVEELPRYLSLAAHGLVTLRKCNLSEGARPAKTFVMMACGKPIVLSASGESAALIRESNGGIVVEPEDPEGLARAVLTLDRDPALAANMGANARRYVEQRFRWHDLIRTWLAQMQLDAGSSPSVPANAEPANEPPREATAAQSASEIE
jgi:colanic acid biosynthesis glycosyl transferase WcaI